MSQTYYQILQVSSDATQDDIKRSYRRLALLYHPDKPTGDEAQFKALQAAYDVLSDPQQRLAYDQQAHGQTRTQRDRSFAQGGFPFTNHPFGMMPGWVPPTMPPAKQNVDRPASDFHMKHKVSLAQLLANTPATVQFSQVKLCSHCQGQGSQAAVHLLCTACKGKGIASNMQRLGNLVTHTMSTCRGCSGRGFVVQSEQASCVQCAGQGTYYKTQKKVFHPADCLHNDEHAIRFVGEGHQGRRSETEEYGDLIIHVIVDAEQHTHLHVHERHHLLVYHTISLVEALQGKACVAVVLPDRTITCDIDQTEPIQHGQQHRLVGEGLPVTHGLGSRGDVIVSFVLKLPTAVVRDRLQLSMLGHIINNQTEEVQAQAHPIRNLDHS